MFLLVSDGVFVVVHAKLCDLKHDLDQLVLVVICFNSMAILCLLAIQSMSLAAIIVTIGDIKGNQDVQVVWQTLCHLVMISTISCFPDIFRLFEHSKFEHFI